MPTGKTKRGAAKKKPSKNGKASAAAPLKSTEAARRLGISPQRLGRLASAGHVPRMDDGRYNGKEVEAAYAEYKKREAEEREAGFGTNGYQDARAELAQIKAERAKIELGIMRKEYIPVARVDDMVRSPLSKMAAILANLPAKLAPTVARKLKIPNREAKKLVAEVANEMRDLIREEFRS